MSKVMLIGGAGFIGSYIARELIGDGDEVIIYDNFINYVNPFGSDYHKHLDMRFAGIKDKVNLIRGDVRSKIHLLKSIKDNKPNKIVCLAAIPDATLTNKYPEDGIDINLIGTINVLEVMRKLGWVERFIFTSSSFTYGDFQSDTATEDHRTAPIDIYGGTKLAAEILTKSYATKYNTPYTIIRPSSVYGPGDTHRRVSRLFVENAMKGKPLILHDGGATKVDFSYVSDVAHGFVLALNSRKAENQTFNMTCGNARSLKEFAEIVKKHIPEAQLIEQPQDERRPERGTLSIDKARKLLGFNPKVQIEDGIPKYIQGLKEGRVVV